MTARFALADLAVRCPRSDLPRPSCACRDCRPEAARLVDEDPVFAAYLDTDARVSWQMG